MIESELPSASKLQLVEVDAAVELDAGRTPSMSRFSMNERTTFRWSLLDDVLAYRGAGIGAIGLWRPKLVEFGEERGVELVRDAGLAVSSLSWAGGFTGAGGHSFAETIDDACEAIRLAGQLNAECLVIVSGAQSRHIASHARRLLLAGLDRLGDLAGEHNLALALQPMHRMFSREWTFLNSLDATLEVLADCDHPQLKMAFDVYHLWQEPGLIERIPEIVAAIATVQLNDWRDPPRSENDRCLPGDGEIPLTAIVRALIEGGYDGFFEIEIWSEELWGSNYTELLRDCITRFDTFCRW